MHPIINIATTAARKAGSVIIRSFERLDTINVNKKGLNNFVTDVDKQAEQEIIAVIRKAYPDHQIIAEESGLSRGNADYVWIIDPLDGTHNYLRGVPHFCVSIAYQLKGKIEHGVIYDPIRQEIFSASRGAGARLNDRRMRVSPNLRLEQALISTGFPVRTPQKLANNLTIFNELLSQVANIRCMGSAALDLAYVAAGRFDAFFELDLKAWDVAAGALLVSEAGGLVGDWQGGENHIKKESILAATPKIFSALMPLLGKYQAIGVKS